MAQAVEDGEHARAAAGRRGPGHLDGSAVEAPGAHLAPGGTDSRLAGLGVINRGERDDLSRMNTEVPFRPDSHPGHADLYLPPGRPDHRRRRAGQRWRGGRAGAVSSTSLALVLGIPLAVVAALRATWSP